MSSLTSFGNLRASYSIVLFFVRPKGALTVGAELASLCRTIGRVNLDQCCREQHPIGGALRRYVELVFLGRSLPGRLGAKSVAVRLHHVRISRHVRSVGMFGVGRCVSPVALCVKLARLCTPSRRYWLTTYPWDEKFRVACTSLKIQ
jgi:hypothetical protein